ncbi:MAG: site-specific DNA-methyltransferase [Actinobacteria bacterium]|nr:site-specific DNA-methyltransferase [Actinomycetota bacterium]
MTRPKRKPTSTSTFGAGRRESHDASAFYERFTPPEISDDDEVARPEPVDQIYCTDARDMGVVPANSVALVVTSPPYFAGKAYEEALGEGVIPGSYLEFLGMLRDVFAECVRVLEPGGRIAVNVANLGRKPYRSLSADVIRILQDDLKLLLRGEIVWWKAKGATGSTAWGSFQSPSNPVLRDLTERVVVASKGRFDRALPRKRRARLGLPSEITVFKDEFMEATTDVWEIPPESATKVGHPAPFPVELPQRLIDLYTYRDDVILDPFIGSGSTAVAAVRTHRHYLGFDTDPEYVAIAEARAAAERARRDELVSAGRPRSVSLPAIPPPASPDEDYQSRAVREGEKAQEVARAILLDCGFVDVEENVKVGPVEVNFAARDQAGDLWYFDVSGAFTSSRPGLRRTDTLWKSLGRAATLAAQASDSHGGRLVLLTTDLPVPGSAGAQALEVNRRSTLFDALEMLSVTGQERLAAYAAGGVIAPLGEGVVDD